MKKHPFIVFALAMTLIIGGIVGFIQSERFALFLKASLSSRLPNDIGVTGDFSKLSITLFPPGIAFNDPKIVANDKNAFNIPPGSRINAERIEFAFLPFQMLSGSIRVHRITIVGGDLETSVKMRGQSFKGKSTVKWDDFIDIRTDAITLINTHLKVSASDSDFFAEFVSQNSSVDQWNSKTGPGYSLDLLITGINGRFPKSWDAPSRLELIRVKAKVNSMGARLEDFAIVNRGVEAQAAGMITGDILGSSELLADAEVSLRGDIRSLVATAGATIDVQKKVGGRIAFAGKLKGSINDLKKDLKIQGAVTGEEVGFEDWKFDRITSEALWEADPQGGQLSFERVILSSRELERTGSAQPGWGGRIEAKPFKFRWGAKSPVRIPLVLDSVHLHWLAIPALKSVFPFTFRASGPLNLTYLPHQAGTDSWKINSELDLNILNLRLDTQSLGVKETSTAILDIKRPVKVKGELTIDSRALVIGAGTTVSIEKTIFDVKGKVDYKSGYDLLAEGPISLEEVGAISEVKIGGNGTLATRVRGPGKAVRIDFDASLKDFEYLNLKLGDLDGRISWDDGVNQLILTGLKLKQHQTAYTAEGKIDLASDGVIDIDANFPKGRIEDLAAIFAAFTHDFWWFPTSLRGEVSGAATIRGKIRMDQLIVHTELKGSNWDFKGEKFRTVSLTGGYDRGRYSVDHVDASKYDGLFSGNISYAADRKFDWALSSSRLSVRDFDQIAKLDVPIRGVVELKSEGTGYEGSIDSKTSSRLSDFSVRGIAMPPSEFTMVSSSGVATTHLLLNGGQGVVDLAYNFKNGEDSFLRSKFETLDFSPLLLFLNPKLIQDRTLTGTISGSTDLSFKSGQFELANGTFGISDYHLSKGGSRFKLSSPVLIKTANGTFNLDSLRILGNQGEVMVSLQARNADLTGSIKGQLDSSIVEFFTPTVTNILGTNELDLAIGGTIRSPVVSGSAHFRGGGFRVASIDSPFESLDGIIRIKQGLVSVENMTVDLAGGRIQTGGTIELFTDRYPKINLASQLLGPRVTVFPFQYAKVQGKLELRGQERPYLVSGKLIIDSALSRAKIFDRNMSKGLRTTSYGPPSSVLGNSENSFFKLDIGVVAPNSVIIQNELLDAEMKAAITLVNSLDAPRVLGTADFVQGKILFKDREFQIQSGQIKFDNPTVINPNLNITATSEVNGTRIQMYISGQFDKPKVSLTSNPSLPEPEILTLLAVGVTSNDAKRGRSGDRSTVEQGEAASLLLHSLDFNRDVQTKTGFEVNLDEAANSQSVNSAFRPRGEAESTAAPKVVIKRKIGKRVEFSVGSTVGVGTSSQREVNAEYRVSPAFSILGVWDTLESVNNQDKTTSYGVDLKLQKRFK